MEVSDVSVFIINSDGEHIEYHEYDGMTDGECVFVCLTDGILDQEYGSDNSIRIHKDWRGKVAEAARDLDHRCWIIDDENRVRSMWQYINSGSCILQSEPELIISYITLRSGMVRNAHLDGARSCRNIMRNASRYTGKHAFKDLIPAIAIACGTSADCGGMRYHGYLPAIGQMMYVNRYISEINGAIGRIGAEQFPMFSIISRQRIHDSWWTSTEYTHSYAIHLDRGGFDACRKETKQLVLPLFTV